MSFNVFDSIRDISENVRQAEELRRLAEGNSLLYHELQHRVKNNLAILASLVDLCEYLSAVLAGGSGLRGG